MDNIANRKINVNERKEKKGCLGLMAYVGWSGLVKDLFDQDIAVVTTVNATD